MLRVKTKHAAIRASRRDPRHGASKSCALREKLSVLRTCATLQRSLSPANLYNYFQGNTKYSSFCQDNSLDRMMASLDKARRLRASVAERLRLVIVSHVRCVLDEVEGSAVVRRCAAEPSTSSSTHRT